MIDYVQQNPNGLFPELVTMMARLEGGIYIQDFELLFSFIVQFLQLSSSTSSSIISFSASSLYFLEHLYPKPRPYKPRIINQMALPAEVTVYKGSKSGKVIKEVVKGRTTLLPNEVAIQMTHSGVRILRISLNQFPNHHTNTPGLRNRHPPPPLPHSPRSRRHRHRPLHRQLYHQIRPGRPHRLRLRKRRLWRMRNLSSRKYLPLRSRASQFRRPGFGSGFLF